MNYDLLKEIERQIRIVKKEDVRTIMELLEKTGPKTVTEIMIHLRKTQGYVSSVLIGMEESGMLESKRNGKFIFYSIRKGYSLILITKMQEFISDAQKSVTLQ